MAVQNRTLDFSALKRLGKFRLFVMATIFGE
jgi:hypothetical protein